MSVDGFHDALKRVPSSDELSDRPSKVAKIVVPPNLIVHATGICDAIIRDDGHYDNYFAWAWIAFEVHLEDNKGAKCLFSQSSTEAIESFTTQSDVQSCLMGLISALKWIIFAKKQWTEIIIRTDNVRVCNFLSKKWTASEKAMPTVHPEFQEAEVLLSRLAQCTIGTITKQTSLALPLLELACRQLRISDGDYDLGDCSTKIEKPPTKNRNKAFYDSIVHMPKTFSGRLANANPTPMTHNLVMQHQQHPPPLPMPSSPPKTIASDSSSLNLAVNNNNANPYASSKSDGQSNGLQELPPTSNATAPVSALSIPRIILPPSNNNSNAINNSNVSSSSHSFSTATSVSDSNPSAIPPLTRKLSFDPATLSNPSANNNNSSSFSSSRDGMLFDGLTKPAPSNLLLPHNAMGMRQQQQRGGVPPGLAGKRVTTNNFTMPKLTTSEVKDIDKEKEAIVDNAIEKPLEMKQQPAMQHQSTTSMLTPVTNGAKVSSSSMSGAPRAHSAPMQSNPATAQSTTGPSESALAPTTTPQSLSLPATNQQQPQSMTSSTNASAQSVGPNSWPSHQSRTQRLRAIVPRAPTSHVLSSNSTNAMNTNATSFLFPNAQGRSGSFNNITNNSSGMKIEKSVSNADIPIVQQRWPNREQVAKGSKAVSNATNTAKSMATNASSNLSSTIPVNDVKPSTEELLLQAQLRVQQLTEQNQQLKLQKQQQQQIFQQQHYQKQYSNDTDTKDTSVPLQPSMNNSNNSYANNNSNRSNNNNNSLSTSNVPYKSRNSASNTGNPSGIKPEPREKSVQSSVKQEHPSNIKSDNQQFALPAAITMKLDSANTTAAVSKPASTPSDPISAKQAQTLGFYTQTVKTDEDFAKFLSKWETMLNFSFALHYVSKIKENAKDKFLDEEMFDFLPSECHVEGIVVSWNSNMVFFVILIQSKTDGITEETLHARWKAIGKVMSNPNSRKICYNAKPHLKILLQHGVEIYHGLRDPKIAAWVLQSEANKDKPLEQLYSEYLKDSKPIKTTIPYEMTFVQVHRSLLLQQHFNKVFSKKEREKAVFNSIEMHITPILAKMEFLGIGFNAESFQQKTDMMELKLKRIEAIAFEMAGREFNMSSPQEVSEVLFGEMKVPFPGTPTKGKRVVLSTKRDVLLRVEHPIASLVLQHRKLFHTINTYTSALPKFAFHNTESKMIRIYSTFLQTAVPTGRLASTDPNLQSIAHPFAFESIKIENDEEIAGGLVTINVRDAFVPRPGTIFISADYSQLELRIMAHYANDEQLISILNSNGDIFTKMASVWKKKPEEDITFVDRRQTKGICYGILYGMGAKSLADTLDVTKQEARGLIESFQDAYPPIAAYLQAVVDQCKAHGFVETILGRRRYLPHIFASGFKEKSSAERQSSNSICQGSAADIAKKAMVDVTRAMRSRKLKSRLVLQLHDELLFEVCHDELEFFVHEVPKIMESAITLNVSLPVKVVIGSSWGSMVEYPEYLKRLQQEKTEEMDVETTGLQ